MKRSNNLKITAMLLTVFALNSYLNKAGAQVTVGSEIAPAKAALLEVKSEENANPSSVTDATNITSKTGGLGLPRVQLVDKTTLEPFIAKTDTEWQAANIEVTKRKHAGLLVYNLTTTSGFKKGMYVWNGANWVLAGDEGQDYFYIPSFNIPITAVATGLTKDLYAEYAKQFTKSGNGTFVCSNSAVTTVPSPINGTLYTPAQLDYVITYYDPTVFENVSISTTGMMTYDVKSIVTTRDSFLNVVFIVKE